jgi:hypothetical protein
MLFTQPPPLCCAEGSVDSAGLKPKVVVPDLIRHPEVHTHSNKKAAPRWALPSAEKSKNSGVIILTYLPIRLILPTVEKKINTGKVPFSNGTSVLAMKGRNYDKNGIRVRPYSYYCLSALS